MSTPRNPPILERTEMALDVAVGMGRRMCLTCRHAAVIDLQADMPEVDCRRNHWTAIRTLNALLSGGSNDVKRGPTCADWREA